MTDRTESVASGAENESNVPSGTHSSALWRVFRRRAAPRGEGPKPYARLKDIEWVEAMPFFLFHAFALWGLIAGASGQAWLVCLALYWIRMFFVTAGYHRYFSHRTFRTSRIGQFLLAFFAQTSSQKGVLWWAAHHRNHHKHSDTELDPHSPGLRGFLYAHLGWIYHDSDKVEFRTISDLAKYPELRFLDRFWFIPPLLLGAGVYAWLGWEGFLVGFVLSTVLVWHGTFLVNSLTHMWGTRRYETSDESRNNFWIALVTMGEGWHNNHHHYSGSTRQGFKWWEIDLTYYILKVLSWFRIVWDLREPPARVKNAVSS